MIQNFKHKGLKKLFETGSTSGVQAQHTNKLRQILALLNSADTAADMDLPGLHFHELIGQRKGTYSVRVSGNWRVTFKMREGDALDIHYEDYH